MRKTFCGERPNARLAVITAAGILPLLLCFLCLPGEGRALALQDTPSAQNKATLSSLQNAFTAIADEMEPAVVTIMSQKTVRPHDNSSAQGSGSMSDPYGDGDPTHSYRMQGIGSGVIITSDGWVLTNDHVVSGADKITVKLHDGRKFEGVVRRDYRSDLALIKITGSGFPTARLGDSDLVKIGQWAITIGSPYHYEGSMSVGVISSLYRRQEITDRYGDGEDRLYMNMIQTDAAINPGNSGGPLVNLDGEVIGINTAIESESGGSVGIGFAIPIDTAKFVIDQLKTRGRVVYGYLGVEPDTLTPRLATAYKVDGGVLVRGKPESGSPAAHAGLEADDVITEINGKPIRTELDLRTLVSRTTPGATAGITLVRNGVTKQLQVTLAEAPDLAPRESIKTPAKPELGLVVGALTPTLAVKAGLARTALGIVIKGLKGESRYADEDQLYRMRPGDVVLRVNGTPTPTTAAFLTVTKGLKPGDVVRVVWQGRRDGQIVQRVTLVTLD